MPAGRPRKPTALKVLHGDDKIHPGRMKRNEPMPTGAVEAPSHLSRPAKELWDQLAPEMIRVRLLTSVDVPLFAEFCESVILARLGRGRALGEATGRIVVAPGAPAGMTAWSRAMVIVIALASRFGLTPSDRARLDLGQADKADSSDLLSPHSWSS